MYRGNNGDQDGVITVVLDNNIEEMTITNARDNLTKFPEWLSQNNRVMPITRNGTPVMAVLPWELYMAIEETLEILADPEMMESLKSSIAEARAGKVLPWNSVKAALEG